MDNGYLSGLIRHPPITPPNVPLLPPPSWSSRGPSGLIHPPHHPHHPSQHIHPPPHYPHHHHHPFGAAPRPTSLHHPSNINNSHRTSRAPTLPRPSHHPPFDAHRHYYDPDMHRPSSLYDSSYPLHPPPIHQRSALDNKSKNELLQPSGAPPFHFPVSSAGCRNTSQGPSQIQASNPSSIFGFGFLGIPSMSHHRDGTNNIYPPGGVVASPPIAAASSATPTSSSFHSALGPSLRTNAPSPREDCNSFTQALFNLSKVPVRNSIASSTCITSVSSSQVFIKTESGSAFSAPSKSSNQFNNVSSSSGGGGGGVISVSDEEVLVDDFDGLCCRTYPLNHSRIAKWREERKKVMKVKDVSSISPGVVGGSSKSSDTIGTATITTTSLTSTTTTNVPLASNSNNAIPVGIAIGRQRQLNEKLSPGSTDSNKRNDSSISSRNSNPAPIPSLLDPSSAVRPSLLHPLGIPPPPPWGTPNPISPGGWPMDRYPDSMPFSPHASPWPSHPPMGPIPMGYQLAKDPLTGQILLIPTDGAGPPRPNSIWPPPQSPPVNAFEGNSTSLSQFHPPTPNSHYHHQLYLQQQHHMHYMRQQASQHHSPHVHQTLHKLRPVPETINLGSSSEEEDDAKKKTKSPALDKNVPETEVDEGEIKENEAPLDSSNKNVLDNEKQVSSEDNEPSSSSKSLIKTNTEEGELNLVEPLSSMNVDAPIIKPDCPTLPLQSEEKLSKESSILKEENISSEIKIASLTSDLSSSENSFDPNICIKSEIIEEEKTKVEEPFIDIKVDDYIEEPDHSNVPDSVVEALLSLGNDLMEEDYFDGIDALIQVLEESIPTFDEENGFELLCRAIKPDTLAYGLPSFFHDAYHLDVNLLCSVTAQEYNEFLNYVDPMVSLRSKYNLHNYHRPDKSQEFISNRIKKAETLKYENGEVDKYEGIKSLAAVIKKIKNTEIMSQLEVEIRGALVQLQSSYKEKQKELARLKSLSPKKKRGNSSSYKRPPGRPKKRKISKNARPCKLLKIKTASEYSESRQRPSLSDNDADEECEDEDEESEDLSPPILEPANSSNCEALVPVSSSLANISSTLLKPPKLTASSSLSKQVTNLSTIKARFMKGKENPFANLMKLATTPSSSKPGSTKSGDSEEDEDGEVEKIRNGPKLSSDDGQSTEEDIHSTSSVSSHKCHEDSNTFSNIIKKRKSDNPQKHSASTETLVTKKPKNLFMMNRLNYPSSFSQDRDEYEFEEDDYEEEECLNTIQEQKKITFMNSKNESSSTSKNNSSSKVVKVNVSTSSHVKKSSTTLSQEPSPELRSAKLSAEDLKDGLKLLMLNDGRFWPARLNSTRLPDVYGIVMEKQRGNRPQILPRDDILQECIMEVKPENKKQIPPGTRVCVYWSSAYNCLFPGTVENNESLIQVDLDDGDRRDVDISNVRMLPYNYSHVFHDPDPIATLRKRRQSSDSIDGSSHHHYKSHVSSTPSKSEPELLKCPSSPEVKAKKKHKHKRHHRCKRRHKKHKPLRVKLDGTFNNTTTYSIRSPPIYSNNRVNGNVESSRITSSHINTPHKKYKEEEEENSDDDDDIEDVKTQKESKEEEEDDEKEQEDYNNDEVYDESAEEDSSSDNDEGHSSHRSLFKGKHSSKFNPVTGRPLWIWGDEGYRRPGSKGKAKKLFHRSVLRDNEVLNVGDCAVFLSMARVDRPYIGRIETFWETWNSGHMMVKVKWFYHPEEIETNEERVDLKIPGGLFQSPHMDENDVQTISHKCSVIPYKDFNSRSSISDKRKKNTMNNTYYLAGNYEPGSFSVQCLSGVLK